MKKRATLVILTAYIIIMAFSVSLLAEPPAPDLAGRWILAGADSQDHYLDISTEGFLTFTDGIKETQAAYQITGSDTLNISYTSTALSAADAELIYTLKEDQLTLNGLTYSRITE